MGKNIFTRIPERGDVCIGRRSDKKIFYITADSYDPSGIDQSVYENQGVVFLRDDEGAHIVGLKATSGPWCDRPWYYISGQQLDGEEHTATFNIRTASTNIWQTNVTKTFTYKATTDEALVKQLNEFFQADEDMVKQDWYADITSGGKIRVHYQANHITQYIYTACKDLSLSNPFPELKTSYSSAIKKNGKSRLGSICSLDRAIAFYHTDTGNANNSGGVNTTQVLRGQTYPINLPCYLGTSTANPGDFCKTLRAYYGEGEEGWMNYMKSMKTQSLCCRTQAEFENFVYTSAKVKIPTTCIPARFYCANYTTFCIPAGNWILPTVYEMPYLIDNNVALRNNAAKLGLELSENFSYLTDEFFDASTIYSYYPGGYYRITGCIYNIPLYNQATVLPITIVSLNF